MATNVYIDGFNLYYGCIRKTPYKWLDISKLCKFLLPRDDINQIKYFTALVSSRPDDKSKPIRQQTYNRALLTIPNVSIIYGQFLTSEVYRHLVNPEPNKSPYVKVFKTEEKGSDVNLATHLLVDGFKGNYDTAVLITNDSDLLEPLKVVKNELGKKIGIINPHKHPSFQLKKEAIFFKSIRKSQLRKSQFPATLTDKNGTFHKPSDW